MKPTITLVARRAGVAISTVSRYLNGHYVSKPVKGRLAKVISQLDYKQSWAARNLSLGRRGSVGVVADSNHSPWFTEILIGIQSELSSQQSSLILATLDSDSKNSRNVAIEWIRAHLVDGLIIVKFGRRDRTLLTKAVELKLPAVLVSPTERLSNQRIVRCDNYRAGFDMANHLADLGHQQIAFEGGRPHLDVKDRLRGLQDGAKKRGIRIAPRQTSFCGDLDARAGMEFGRRFLAKPFRVTAIVFGNDALALGFMRVAQQRGVSIPRNLSVAGFDDIPASSLVWPGLTTVAQPMREMGGLACRMIFEEHFKAPRASTQLPMHLVVRESTASPQ